MLSPLKNSSMFKHVYVGYGEELQNCPKGRGVKFFPQYNKCQYLQQKCYYLCRRFGSDL